MIDVPIYRADICFSLCQTEEEIKLLLKKFTFKNKDFEIGDLGRAIRLDDAGPYLIWVKNYPSTITDLTVLLHEIHHITNMILWDRGLELTKDSEEAFTYLLEFITKEALQKSINGIRS